jgi:hypothetical protein
MLIMIRNTPKRKLQYGNVSWSDWKKKKKKLRGKWRLRHKETEID